MRRKESKETEAIEFRGWQNHVCYSVMGLGLIATTPWINAWSQSGLIVPLRWKHGIPFQGEYEAHVSEMAAFAQAGVIAFFAGLIFQLARPKLK